MVSCKEDKQDSDQTQQVTETTTNDQFAPLSTETAQPIIGETAQNPMPAQNNSDVQKNPPHGQPNHRCDIPVGAPLNSPPANKQPTTGNPAVNTTPPTASSPNPPTMGNTIQKNPSQTTNTVPANSGTKPRLNPAHGQPFHRCDIKVGDPLP